MAPCATRISAAPATPPSVPHPRPCPALLWLVACEGEEGAAAAAVAAAAAEQARMLPHMQGSNTMASPPSKGWAQAAGRPPGARSSRARGKDSHLHHRDERVPWTGVARRPPARQPGWEPRRGPSAGRCRYSGVRPFTPSAPPGQPRGGMRHAGGAWMSFSGAVGQGPDLFAPRHTQRDPVQPGLVLTSRGHGGGASPP